MERHTDAAIYFLIISFSIVAVMYMFSLNSDTFWGNVALIWVGFIVVYVFAKYRKPIYELV